MVLAAPSLVRGLVGVDRRSPSGFSNSVIRAMGQGMQAAVTGFNGGANRSARAKIRIRSPVPFRRAALVFVNFQSTGTPIKDVLFSGTSAEFFAQWGIGAAADAVTGLAPRTPFRFKGANYVRVNSAVDTSGIIISDWTDFGRWYTTFDLHGAQELPSGVTPNNSLPYTVTGTNFFERWMGQQFAAGSIIAGAGGGADDALTATSITKLAATQTGVAGVFLPAYILIECNESVRCICIAGDSLTQGSNEGAAGSSTFGDSMGSPLSNNGYGARGVFETAGLMGFNISKGSDGVKFTNDPANWLMRAQLAVRAGATHFFDAYGLNDVAATITITGWAQSEAITKYLVRSANSGIWMALNAGTSLGSGTGPTGVPETFQDNDVLWYRVGNFPGSANPRGYAQITAWMIAYHDEIRRLMPRVKIVKGCIPPDATSADQGITQTASTGWGDGTSRRGLTNVEIRALRPRLLLSDFIDINLNVEDSYPPTETGKMITDGNANYIWSDHSHPNSRGQSLYAANILAAKFA